MRRLVFLVYALVFTTELSQAAIVPLLPGLERDLSMSGVQTGAVLAAATFATLALAVPVGLLSDRLGPHRLAVAAGVLVSIAAVAQAVAQDFWTLLAGRAVYGAGFAIVWTAGVALVSSATSARRAAAIGGTITIGGLAHFVGPTASGFLAEHAGVWAPFAIVAVLAAVVAGLLAGHRPPAFVAAKRQPLREALGAARQHEQLRGVLVVMGLLGVVAGIVPLLVPIVLDENGLSAGQIGAVFSAGAAVWILASATATRLGRHAVGLGTVGFGILLMGAVLLLPVATLATAGIGAFLVLRAAVHAPISTVAYPLAETGARVAGIGGGTAIGLANVVWAAAAATSPIVGGALTGTIGARWTFAAVAVLCAAAGAWILGEARAAEARPALSS